MFSLVNPSFCVKLVFKAHGSILFTLTLPPLDNTQSPPPNHPLSLRIETNNFSKRNCLRQTQGRAFSWSFLFASDVFVNGMRNKIKEEDINDKENLQLAGVRDKHGILSKDDFALDMK